LNGAAEVKPGQQAHRVAHIDGLRAVAVLSVIVFHTAKYSGISVTGPLAHIVRAGSHGVDLFFVLSGFCLSYPMLARLERHKEALFDVAGFASRRIVRIVPPYLLAIATFLGFLTALHAFGIVPPKPMPQSGLTMTDVLMQAFFLDKDVRLLNGSFWTLPIEFRWYFVFPIFLLLWVRSPRLFAALGAFAFVLVATLAAGIDFFLLPAFLLGIVAASLRVRRVELGPWPTIAFFILLLSAYTTMAQTGWNYDLNPLWYLAAFAFVLTVNGSAGLSRLLAAWPLAAIGLASYSIYLVHEPLIALLERGGINPFVAASAGIAFGFTFWFVAERPFVQTSLRSLLISELKPVFDRWLRWLNVPTSIGLTSPATLTTVLSKTTTVIHPAVVTPQPVSLAFAGADNVRQQKN
jgi:peptidoglycan/LPS O-acetylase OafA/YrhL